jgi:hypothetical protein
MQQLDLMPVAKCANCLFFKQFSNPHKVSNVCLHHQVRFENPHAVVCKDYIQLPPAAPTKTHVEFLAQPRLIQIKIGAIVNEAQT